MRALLDMTREDDRHTSERLSREPIVWVGTVRSDGRPHTVPVWFAWSDPSILVFSMRNTTKLKNVQRHPLVSLSLDAAGGGTDVVIAEGQAFSSLGAPDIDALSEDFARKYRPLLAGTTFEAWRSTFTEVIPIRVTRIISWTRDASGVAYRSVP